MPQWMTMFRWDQKNKAAGVAAVVAVCGAITLALTDGKITNGEWATIALAFGGTFFGYLKDHPTDSTAPAAPPQP